MSFLKKWCDALPASFETYAKLATETEQMFDFTYGLPGAAILEPASQPVKMFNLEAMQVIKEITDGSNVVLDILQRWHADRLEAVRILSTETKQSDALRAELTKLLDHFNALPTFYEALARTMMAQKETSADVYHVAKQIKAAMVNVGGETNITNLTININWAASAPGPASGLPADQAKPRFGFEPETIEIPAGPFTMGSPQFLDRDNWRAHTVKLGKYRIGITPVTNKQYQKFIDARLVQRRAHYTEQANRHLEHPVVGVSWADAVAYCNWLSEVTGRIYRLPSEAQWEKAARGSQDARRYPWGDEFKPAHCNYNNRETTPVGEFAAGQSPYGCLDMVGNVWEWTCTLWGRNWRRADFCYPYQADDGRENLVAPSPIFRVFRGGSFRDSEELIGCSVRNYYVPDFQFKDVGFRVVEMIDS